MKINNAAQTKVDINDKGISSFKVLLICVLNSVVQCAGRCIFDPKFIGSRWFESHVLVLFFTILYNVQSGHLQGMIMK